MRYITQHGPLVLYTDTGGVVTMAYRFGQDGVLDLGTGNEIATTNMYVLFSTALLGAATPALERCGMGSLVGTDDDGSALTNLEDGYRGFFFEAPFVEVTSDPSSPGTVPALAGIHYKVYSGTLTYNSVSYSAGKTFITDGSATSVTGDGKYAVVIPPALSKKVEEFTAEQFKIGHLKTGDEPYDYWLPNKGGFDGRSSLLSTDADFWGYIRTT